MDIWLLYCANPNSQKYIKSQICRLIYILSYVKTISSPCHNTCSWITFGLHFGRIWCNQTLQALCHFSLRLIPLHRSPREIEMCLSTQASVIDTAQGASHMQGSNILEKIVRYDSSRFEDWRMEVGCDYLGPLTSGVCHYSLYHIAWHTSLKSGTIGSPTRPPRGDRLLLPTLLQLLFHMKRGGEEVELTWLYINNGRTG